MRKSTLMRLIVLVMLIGTLGVTGMNADTQTCHQRCETSYNQCMAFCSWWNLFCVQSCADQLQYCQQWGCNNGNDGEERGPKDPHP
jgi:hypothetical protein